MIKFLNLNVYQTYQKMSEFSLFQQALEQYKQIVETKEETNEKTSSSCAHDNVIVERGTSVCVDCGEEIQHKISQEKEWRYYGQSDNKHVKDPNRVQARKLEDRNIFKDVENLPFSESIVSRANAIYTEVTKGKIFRGNSRRAIVFACIFHAYKLSDLPQSHDGLMKIFGLERKIGLKGLKHVNIYAPKESKIRTTYITPKSLIHEIMAQFSATKEQIQEVVDIYERIKNTSSRINRSRPQSTASGLVFYWIKLRGKNITLKEFAKKVSLSELTINKIAKEIEELVA